MSRKLEIIGAIVDQVNGWDFKTVRHTTAGKPELTGTTIKATSCKVNETTATFAEDKRYKRDGFRYVRQAQQILLLVSFNAEVSLEDFEDYFCTNPITLPLSADSPGVKVRLDRAVYSHPTTSGGQGSEALLTFVAQEMRR